MDQREHDYQELRPLGEALPVADPVLEERQEHPRRTDQVGYGNSRDYDHDSETESKCRSCRASIPSHRTKCLFCLSEHIEPSGRISDSNERLLSVIFIAVDALTIYEAAAKGTAACRKLVSDEGPIDGYQLVYDIDEPAPQLVERWAELPSAAELDSGIGQYLLSRLVDLVDEDSASWSPAHETIPILYIEWAKAIDNHEQVLGLEEEPNQWLVPALTLQEQSQSNRSPRTKPRIPTKKRLFCRDCDEETIHRFDGRDLVADRSLSSTPIWSCDRCATPRLGPDPV